MLIEIRARSQFTLPAEIVKKLGVSEGDKFEVFERDGGVFLCPVVVYPKSKILEWSKIIEEHKKNPSTVYNTVEDMFEAFNIDLGSSDV